MNARFASTALSVLGGAAVQLAIVCSSLLFAEAPPCWDETVRPFDQIVLKKGGTIIGTMESPGDITPFSDVVITTKGGTSTMKLKGSDIESVVARRPAEDAYRELKKCANAEHDPAKRAGLELKLGLWSKAPLLALDGARPRADAALGHLLSAVELDPTLVDAYPHILGILSADSPDDGGAGVRDAASADRDRVARVAILAERGGYKDPEIDFRIGSFLVERLQLPGRARFYLERMQSSGHKNLGQLRRSRSLLAEIYRGEGTPEKAIALYEAVITKPEMDPANFEPFYELGRLQSRTGTLEGARAAREYFARAQKIQPDFLEIPAELAALDYRAGNLAGAEKTLKALLAKDPGNVPAAISLALVRVRLGRFELAEKALKPLLAQASGPDKARAHLALGIILENRGDDLGCFAQYREAVACFPQDEAAAMSDPCAVEAMVALAAVMVRLGRPEETRAIANALMPLGKELRAAFAVSSRLLGEADLAEGKTDPALSHLLRAVEVDSADPALFERAGILLLRQGKLDAGFQMLLRARQAGGERPDTMNAMAYYHYTRGELDTARKIFEAVLKLVPAPPKPTGRDAKGPPVPPARIYALRGRELIDDLGRLEMWSADFGGPDAPTLDGWEETERFGVEISRKGSRVVLAGKQAGAADGVTQAMLDRPVDVPTFDRLAMSARVDSGKVRLGLRLEGLSSKGGATAGLVLYRDFDGVLRCQLKTTTGDWEPVPRVEDAAPESGKLVNPETTMWPEDAAFHTLEIRRAGRRTTATSAAAAKAGVGFDLYFDGQPVIWNVKVTGLGGRTYEVGVSGQTDTVGAEYSISVESFKVYRERPVRRAQQKF